MATQTWTEMYFKKCSDAGVHCFWGNVSLWLYSTVGAWQPSLYGLIWLTLNHVLKVFAFFMEISIYYGCLCCRACRVVVRLLNSWFIQRFHYYYFIRTQSTSNTISTFHKNQQIITSNGEKEKMIELNELKSATIICLKATTHPQADQHVQYTECLKSYIIKLLASA